MARRRPVSAAAVLCATLLAAASPLSAQWPGVATGRVTDHATGAAIEGASVELPGLGVRVRSDATGRFRMRGLEPGRHELVARHIGYAEYRTTIDVVEGRATQVSVRLERTAIVLPDLTVRAERRVEAGAIRLERAAIRRSGARTAGDAVARLPGVVVRRDGVNGAQTVSIRGGGPDAVLVLVDGAPLNDPVTGEADLSGITADAIERVTVLRGARPRYGPRAETGVVLIETRRSRDRGLAATLEAGSLAERAAALEGGLAIGGIGLGLGVSGRAIDGGFDVRSAGALEPVRRRNNDRTEVATWAAADARIAGGEARLRAGVERMRRGLPGKVHAPTPAARQRLDIGRASLSWDRSNGRTDARAAVFALARATRSHDPAPAFGPPYDDTTRVASLGASVGIEIADPGVPGLRGLGAGLDARIQRIASGMLAPGAPGGRADGGAHLGARVGRTVGTVDVELATVARIDRDGLTGRWRPTHELAGRARLGAFEARLAHRSGFSPPTLGDQFFHGGVAVAPNPDLRAERVPGEIELGVSGVVDLGGMTAAFGADVHRGDIRDMILWAPDYRFVWSPRNYDVKRRGGDLWLRLSLPASGISANGGWSHTAVRYDRPGDADDVQVVYRPRNTLRFGIEWARDAWRAALSTARTGRRNTAPATVNALPAFWSADAELAREWDWNGWPVAASVRVDRVLDGTDSLIFGYPEPGRRVRVALELRSRGDRPGIDP